MPAGRLRERVTIQTATVTRDAFGGEVLSWADSILVWASVVERGGREPILADRPVMVVAYEVTIRKLAVTNKERLSWRGKILAIDVVTPKPADGLVVLRCLEVDALGDASATGRADFEHADNSGYLGVV